MVDGWVRIHLRDRGLISNITSSSFAIFRIKNTANLVRISTRNIKKLSQEKPLLTSRRWLLVDFLLREQVSIPLTPFYFQSIVNSTLATGTGQVLNVVHNNLTTECLVAFFLFHFSHQSYPELPLVPIDS